MIENVNASLMRAGNYITGSGHLGSPGGGVCRANLAAHADIEYNYVITRETLAC